MANIKSAQKRIRGNNKKSVLNNDIKSRMKTSIKSLEKAVAQGKKKEATENLNVVHKMIDKAFSKGIIKKNASARYKSRTSSLVNDKK
jgi:small subunit ribosomal protein S20